MTRFHHTLAFSSVLTCVLGTAAIADSAHITATGMGFAKAQPDNVTLTTTVSAEGKNVEEANKAYDSAENRLVATLAAMGEKDGIRTNNRSLSTQSGFTPKGAEPNPPTYVANGEVSTTVHNLAHLSGAMAAMMAAQRTNMTLRQTYGYNDVQAMAVRARADAVRDAMERARLYASAAGVTLGPLESITDGAGAGAAGLDSIFSNLLLQTAANKDARPLATVTVTYAIKP